MTKPMPEPTPEQIARLRAQPKPDPFEAKEGSPIGEVEFVPAVMNDDFD